MASVVKKEISQDKKTIKEIWRRVMKRDFSGNTGLVIKNSIYQFSTNMSAKLGAFIFTIILARLLMPELFGLYNLVLSTILIFGAFSELGIGTAIIRFLSKEFGKKNRNLKAYIFYFGKIKIILLILISLAILIFSRYLSDTFYQKPIFFALLAGILYTIFNQINGFLKGMIQAANKFNSVFKREIVFQVSRIILVPLAVILSIKYSLSNETILTLIILSLSFSAFLASLLLFFDVRKNYSKYLKKEKTRKLSKNKKHVANGFLIGTAALVLSGAFFGNIDRVMLGKFVTGEFIGFYTAASNLVGALAAMTGSASAVLLPIFSKLKGKRLEKGLQKSLRMTLLISISVFILIIVLANVAILIAYGKDYLPATNILRLLSLILFILPVMAIYQSYFISQGKPNRIAILLIVSTLLNIVLNYVLITSLLPYGSLAAVYGAAIATIISQVAYLGGMMFFRN